jgi:hypothetical protein
MNTHYYYIAASVIGFVVIVFIILELHRAHAAARKIRIACPLCGNPSPERKHLRRKKPVDPSQQSIIWRWLSRGDMYLQTQKRCQKLGCEMKNKWQLEKTDVKCFTLVKMIFHPDLCKENAKPEDFLGYVRELLIKAARPKTVVPFAKPPLPKVELPITTRSEG